MSQKLLKKEVINNSRNQFMPAFYVSVEKGLADVMINDIQLFISSSIDHILETAKGCVPEEQKVEKDYSSNDLIWSGGFNSCRQQVIDNINKL